jgi:hypothetical protein
MIRIFVLSCAVMVTLGLAACGDDATGGCPEGLSDCEGTCVNLQIDRAHCGACGTACNPGEVCSAGACALSCQVGLTDCDGVCVDTGNDRDNCGACGTVCGPGEVCSDGTCSLSCQLGLTDCNGTCVDTNTDRANCGTCGTTCNDGEVCSAGTCALSCQLGLTDCNGTCVDTNTDRANCGTCGTTCNDGEVCAAGICSLTCPAGLTDCGGSCVNTDNDPANCGACADAGGAVCADGEVCIDGGCVATGGCPAPLIDCDGACVDTTTDRAHCGGCAGAGGTVCVAGEICTGGVCTLSCQAGLTDCGGVCVDTAINPNHCGGCAGAGGQICASDELCHQGLCQTPSACTTDAECASDELCIGGLCVPKCTSRADCLARDPGGHPYCRDDGMCVAMPESDCLGTTCYVWFVDAASSAPVPDGLTWATAFPAVGEANAVVQAGEEVWVANGRYTSSTPGLTVLTMVEGANFRGGFAGDEAALGDRPPLLAPHQTILDGENTSLHVVEAASNTLLEGFSVQNGNADGARSDEIRGGGLHAYGVDGLTLANCDFIGSYAYHTGGGIYVTGSEIDVRDVRVIGNSSDWIAGGMYVGESLVTIERSIFHSNSTYFGSGGLRIGSFSIAKIANSRFIRNTATQGAGALFREADVVAINCSFLDNDATETGGAVRNFGCSPVYTNCTFVGNRAAEEGGAMFNRRGTFDLPSAPVIRNCLFFNNTAGSNPDIKNATVGGDTSSVDIANSCVNLYGTSPNGVVRASSGEVFLDHVGGSSCLNVGSDAAANHADYGYPAAGLDWVDLTTSVEGTPLDTDDSPGEAVNDVDVIRHHDPAHVWIKTFNAVYVPGGADLYWTTNSAVSCSIDNGVGPVATENITGLSVTPGATTDYTLTCTGPGGPSSATARIVLR